MVCWRRGWRWQADHERYGGLPTTCDSGSPRSLGGVMKTRKNAKSPSVCKQCNREFTGCANKQRYCTPECKALAAAERRITATCCVCEKEIVRYRSATKLRSNFCCSLACQRVWSLGINRGRQVSDYERSMRAKE